ncbi:MAG: transposase [Xenococcaceae cyanobacterium MO_188.B32]|nr:transposase [Xenococcaceae cyanobacterium MO_188.B32]
MEVCHPCCSRSHRRFENIAGWGKNFRGWHYSFKLHLIIKADSSPTFKLS